MKKLLVTSAVAISTLSGLAVAGIANADTSTTTSGSSSLVDKIASKFNLNKSDVQQVFDQNRTEHQAQRAADQKARLDQAVTDGKLTQAQEDYIVNAQAEIKTLIGTSKPGELSQTTEDAAKAKMTALRDWAKTNNVSMRYVAGFGGHRGGPGMGMRGEAPDDDSTTSNSATTN